MPMLIRNLLIVTSSLLFITQAKAEQDDWQICRAFAAQAEAITAVPLGLIQALSLAESGRHRGGKREYLAWPWTVMAEGMGRYLPSKAAAIEEVERLRARGIKNIDVGCMQVNLHYHPDAFATLETAFDPAHNIAYATKFLLDLRMKHRSWTAAIGRYHSGRPLNANKYRARVMKIWRKERQRLSGRS